MMKKIAFLIMVAVIAMAGYANAGTEAGNKEIQVQGSLSNFTNSENADKTLSTNIQINLNYFFTSWVSIGGTWRGSSSINEPESGEKSETTSNFLLLRLDFYLGKPTSKAVFYLGGQVGSAMYTYKSENYESSGSTTAFGGHAGVKFFASEDTSWNLELDSTQYTPEAEEGQQEITYTNTSFMVGFSYYF